ncbi:uncharacterized protein LOC131883694 isoform X2 [Tigriopus californicus]|uniref:uncharacterized protein LOC131883694 isoform X2 n=1 Tax=Tigriopus californicus TaxID=6832 RepID=UPI0027DA600D|nr:uncharacterized protein LOC131883694 isoform X2 [Tigriopus californicus]
MKKQDTIPLSRWPSLTQFWIGRIPVLMRHASYLDSHVLCLNMLLTLSYEWKMWVHISPGDFPIRSIDELRRNLKFNNKTIIDVRINEHQNRQGRVYGYDIISHSTHQIQKRVISNSPIEPPCNLVIAEGDPCVALLKDDVKALLGTTIPLHLFHWFRHSDVPEQHFFATLATITVIQEQRTGQFLAPIVFDFDQIITPNMMSSEHECVRSFEWYQGIRMKRSENGIPEENHFHLLRLCHKNNDTCQQPHMLLETLKLTEPPKKLPFEDTAICMRKQIISRSACEKAEFKRSCHVHLSHLRELQDSQCFFGNYFDSQNEGSRALACQMKSLLGQ